MLRRMAIGVSLFAWPIWQERGFTWLREEISGLVMVLLLLALIFSEELALRWKTVLLFVVMGLGPVSLRDFNLAFSKGDAFSIVTDSPVMRTLTVSRVFLI